MSEFEIDNDRKKGHKQKTDPKNEERATTYQSRPEKLPVADGPKGVREKWTFYFVIVRTIAAVISLAIAIFLAIGGGFVPLP